MKHLNKITIATILLGGLAGTGCKKSDLFKPPTTSIAAESAFSTADRIEKNAIGMYNQLQNANYLGGRTLIYADIRGIDALGSTFFGNMALYTTLTANDATVASAYQGGYRTIYETNLFLQSLEQNKDKVPPAKADQYTGEAKFIRALSYFYLINLYAQPYNFSADASHAGVPLVTSPAADPFGASNQIARASVKQVYDQMEADLLDAEVKLPLTATDAYSKVARATKGAARGLLMRIYLYKGDYAKAQQYADLIISSNLYALNSDIKTTFSAPYTSNESIFSVAHNGSDNPNTNNALGQHYGATLRGDITVSPDYLALMDITTDKRFLSLVQKVGSNYWSTKYAAGVLDWVPVLRYSEVLLTKAEALARLSATVSVEAVNLVNQVRTRAAAAPIAPLTKDELINLIIRERRIELAFEGQASFDFQRLKLDIPAHGLVTVQPWGSQYRILPIPKYDIDKNPNLVQNPGY